MESREQGRAPMRALDANGTDAAQVTASWIAVGGDAYDLSDGGPGIDVVLFSHPYGAPSLHVRSTNGAARVEEVSDETVADLVIEAQARWERRHPAA